MHNKALRFDLWTMGSLAHRRGCTRRPKLVQGRRLTESEHRLTRIPAYQPN